LDSHLDFSISAVFIGANLAFAAVSLLLNGSEQFRWARKEKTKSMMFLLAKGSLLYFPDIPTERVTMTRTLTITNRSVPDQEALKLLLRTMFCYPEREVSLYIGNNEGVQGQLKIAIDQGRILAPVCEYGYYEFEVGSNLFGRIASGLPGEIEYIRIRLELSERTRRHFEVLEREELAQQVRSVWILKPNVYGIGMDLKTLWHKLWLRRTS
jgi:hypothetical protein